MYEKRKHFYGFYGKKLKVTFLHLFLFFFFFFFYQVFFHRHWQLTGQQGKGGDLILFHSATSTHFHSLSLSTHEHSDIYLKHCMWDDCHVILISMLVFTRLLLDEIFITLLNYHLIDWLMMQCLFLYLVIWF